MPVKVNAPAGLVQEMYALYEQGASLQEVGEAFGVSKPFVSKRFKAAGLQTRPSGSPAAEYPVQEMYALYEQGVSLHAVGERFGTSTELTRLIFARAGLKSRTREETSTLKRKADLQRAEETADAIVDRFSRVKDLSLTASELEISEQKVRSVLRDRLSEHEYRAAIPKQEREPRYTEAELIGFLQKASAEITEPLSMAFYEKFADSQRAAEGRPWPNHQTYGNRFGSWREALLRAGLSANATTPAAGVRVFDADQCIDAVRGACHTLGKIPSAQE